MIVFRVDTMPGRREVRVRRMAQRHTDDDILDFALTHLGETRTSVFTTRVERRPDASAIVTVATS